MDTNALPEQILKELAVLGWPIEAITSGKIKVKTGLGLNFIPTEVKELAKSPKAERVECLEPIQSNRSPQSRAKTIYVWFQESTQPVTYIKHKSMPAETFSGLHGPIYIPPASKGLAYIWGKTPAIYTWKLIGEKAVKEGIV